MEGNTMKLFNTTSKVLKTALLAVTAACCSLSASAQFENLRVQFNNERCRVVMIGSSAIELNDGTCLAADENNNSAAQQVRYTSVTVGGNTYNHTSSASIDLNGSDVCNKTVTKAYLYWGGSRYHGSTDAFWNTTIKVAGPDLVFKNVSATAHGSSDATNGGDDRDPYWAFADVTSQLSGQVAGTFYVQGVPATLDKGSSEGGPTAAWTLILVFDDRSYPVTDFYLYDGMAWIGYSDNSGKTRLNVSGLSVPSAGEIGAFYGLASIDGDVAKNKHEYITFQAKGGVSTGSVIDLNALRGTSDFLNSSITYNGAQVERSPNCINAIGWDSHHLDIPEGSVPNSTTNIDLIIDMTRDGNKEESIYPFMTYLGVVHEQPNVVLTKASSNPSVTFGKKYQYTIVAHNYGGTPTDANTAVLVDTLDANVDLIGATGNARVMVDGVDRTASCAINYNSATRELRFSNLPSIPANPGEMVFTYQVQVKEAEREDLWRLECNQAVYNRGHLTYTFETLDEEHMTIVHATTNEATGAYSCNPSGEYTIVPITSPMPEYDGEFTHHVTEPNGSQNLTTYLRNALKQHLGNTDYSLGNNTNEFSFYTNDTYTTSVNGSAMLNIADGATQNYYAKRNFTSPVAEKGVCSETYTIHLNRVACSLVVTPTVTKPLCSSTQTDKPSGVINVAITDGNDATAAHGMTYSLYASDGITLLQSESDVVSLSYAFSQVAPGTYNVTVTDYLGCTTTESAMVNDPDPIAILLTNDPNCAGQPSTLEATITAPAGQTDPEDYVFKWYRSTDGSDYALIDSVVGVNTYAITSYANTLYMKVEAYYANALCEDIECKGTQATTFESGATPMISNTDTVQVVCSGTDLTPITLAAVSAIDGTTDVTASTAFTWSLVSSTGVSETVTLPTTNVLAAQTLTATTADTGLVRLRVVPTATSGSCEGDPITILLKVAPGPQADFSYEPSMCPNCSQIVTANVTAGEAPFTYTWALASDDDIPDSVTIAKDAECTNAQTKISFVGCTTDADLSLYITDKYGCKSPVIVHTISTNDNTAPTWSSAAGELDRTVEGCNAASITAAMESAPVATDNCSSDAYVAAHLTSSYTDDVSCAYGYVRTRTWYAYDSCGNQSAPYVQTITVRDLTAPDIAGTVADQLPVPTGTNCNYTVPDVTELVRALASDACTDNANLNITQSPVAGSPIASPFVASVIEVSVKDECDNEATTTVNLLAAEDFEFSLSKTSEAVCDGISVDISEYYVKPAATGYTYVVTNSASDVVSSTLSTAGTYTVTCTSDATGCSKTDEFTLTVNAMPDFDVTTPDPICNGQSIILANYVTVTPASTVTFYSDNTYSTEVTEATTSNTYYIKAVTTVGSCEATSTIDVTVNPIPSVPTVTNREECEQTGTIAWNTLASVSDLVNETLVWYTTADVAVGGTPTAVDLSSAANSASYKVAARNTTTGCESEKATVSVTINASPAAPTVTPYNECGTLAVGSETYESLVTSIPTGTTLVWYETDAADAPVIGNPGTFATNVASDFDKTYYVAARATATSCYSAKEAVTVHVSALPDAPTTGNFSECADPTASTKAWSSLVTVPAGHTAVWYSADNDGDVMGSEPAAVDLTTAFTSKTYYVALKNTTTNCTGARSPVTIEVLALPALPTVTNYAECISTGTLAWNTRVSVPEGYSVAWYATSADDAAEISEPAAVDLTTASTTTYYVAAENNTTGCVGAKTPVTIAVNEKPAALVVDAPYEECATTGTLAWIDRVTVPAGQTAIWFDSDADNAEEIAEPADVDLSVATDLTYYVAARNANGCVGPKTAVTITVFAIPATPTAVSVDFCAEQDANVTFASIIPAAPANCEARWYEDAGKVTACEDNDPGVKSLSVNNTSATKYFSWYNVDTHCESDAVAATINVLPDPIITVTNDDVKVCEGTTVTLADYASVNTGTLTFYSDDSYTSSVTTLSYTDGLTHTYYLQAVGTSVSTEGETCKSFATMDVTIADILDAPANNEFTSCITTGTKAWSDLVPTVPDGYERVWYATPSSAGDTDEPAAVSLASASEQDYYVTYRATTAPFCESEKATLHIEVYAQPAAPEVVANHTVCAASTASNYAWNASVTVPSGYEAIWYSADDDEAVLASEPAAVDLTVAAVSETYVALKNTTTNCVGPRAKVMVTVKEVPVAPTTSTISQCPAAASDVRTWASLVSGTTGTINWYEEDGVTPATAPTTFDLAVPMALTQYYVSQTVNGCESAKKLVSVEITNTPTDPVVEDLVQCVATTGTKAWSDLVPTTGTLLWYTEDNDGTIIGSEVSPDAPTDIDLTTASDNTYYVIVKDASGCKSNRVPVTATIHAMPDAPANDEYLSCIGTGTKAWSDLVPAAPAGQEIVWYATPTSAGSTTVPDGVSLETETDLNYYATYRMTSAPFCESDKATLHIKVFAQPSKPANNEFTSCIGTGTKA